MTHLELENLASEYLEGRLEPTRSAQVEEHLAGCESCRGIVSDVQFAMQACQSAEEVTPPTWLLAKIRLATVGEERVGFFDHVGELFRNFRQPRFAYAVAMTVFSLSLIANIAGLNLRGLSFSDLNPTTWVYRANRAGHLLYARVEKFYDDLRIVYEIESRFRNVQSQQSEKEKQNTKPNPPSGGPASTADPGTDSMAYAIVNSTEPKAQRVRGVQPNEMR
ncbi:MAG: zf-HC2 domain-containing protein [Acidobacteriota bacterium]